VVVLLGLIAAVHTVASGDPRQQSLLNSVIDLAPCPQVIPVAFVVVLLASLIGARMRLLVLTAIGAGTLTAPVVKAIPLHVPIRGEVFCVLLSLAA
jgi:hypothetical protein